VSGTGFSLWHFSNSDEQTMRHRKFTILLALLTLATLTASATDFWLTKDWHQWSKDECTTILNDSPWTRTQDAYTVQLRSALPIREAIVRQLEIVQGYDQKSPDQRKAFDSAAGTILNTSYDKTILVRLSFSKDAPALGPTHPRELQVMLVTEDGQQINPTQIDIHPITAYAVDFYFPRLKDGGPAIKPAQKQFSFQFQAPSYVDANHVTIITKQITINFDLTKMLVDGKPNY
jgi:hypothetical protein